MTTHTISIHCSSRKDFDLYRQIIKNTAGKYDPGSKTWTITSADGVSAAEELATYSRLPVFAIEADIARGVLTIDTAA